MNKKCIDKGCVDCCNKVSVLRMTDGAIISGNRLV